MGAILFAFLPHRTPEGDAVQQDITPLLMAHGPSIAVRRVKLDLPARKWVFTAGLETSDRCRCGSPRPSPNRWSDRRKMAEDTGAPVPCAWCGLYTSVGAACDTCGSPMEVLSQCRYCGAYSSEEICLNCQESLSTMSILVRTSPDKPLLKQAIDQALDRSSQ